MRLKIIFVAALFMMIVASGNAQTFDCYIVKDTLVSPTTFEFDLYIVSTSTDFLFQTAQLAFKINPDFTPAGDAPTISFVAGSSEMKWYRPGKFRFNTKPSLSAFQVTSNPQGNCSTDGTLISKKPVRIGKFRIVSNSGNFTKAPANLSMIQPKDQIVGGEVNLKMAITVWSTNDCSLPTSKPLTRFGKYYTK